MTETITRTNAHGVELTITPGVLDEHAARLFVQGQCHAMALEIHRLTGWPLALAGGRRRASGGRIARVRRAVRRPARYRAYHVVCQLPDGRYIDSKGVHDRAWMHLAYTNSLKLDGLYADYEADIRSDISAHWLRRFTATRGWQRMDEQLAREFAPLVLAQAGMVVDAAA